jgi:hypothetical protein
MPENRLCANPDCGKPLPAGSNGHRKYCNLKCMESFHAQVYKSTSRNTGRFVKKLARHSVRRKSPLLYLGMDYVSMKLDGQICIPKNDKQINLRALDA